MVYRNEYTGWYSTLYIYRHNTSHLVNHYRDKYVFLFKIRENSIWQPYKLLINNFNHKYSARILKLNKIKMITCRVLQVNIYIVQLC